MTKEFEKNRSEYNIPRLPEVNEKPGAQVFGFVGLIAEGDNIYIDLVYGLSNRHFGTVIRTAVDDGFNYKIVNWVDYWEDKNPIPAHKIEYNYNLYNSASNKLRIKQLSVEQISVFARLVNSMAKENGLENLNDETIFNNEAVIKILGLDKDDAFDYTPVKKTFEKQIPVLV